MNHKKNVSFFLVVLFRKLSAAEILLFLRAFPFLFTTKTDEFPLTNPVRGVALILI
jgi:hypothetical protein